MRVMNLFEFYAAWVSLYATWGVMVVDSDRDGLMQICCNLSVPRCQVVFMSFGAGLGVFEAGSVGYFGCGSCLRFFCVPGIL